MSFPWHRVNMERPAAPHWLPFFLRAVHVVACCRRIQTAMHRVEGVLTERLSTSYATMQGLLKDCEIAADGARASHALLHRTARTAEQVSALMHTVGTTGPDAVVAEPLLQASDEMFDLRLRKNRLEIVLHRAQDVESTIAMVVSEVCHCLDLFLAPLAIVLQ